MSNVSSRKNLLLAAAVSALALANYSLGTTAQAEPAVSTVSGSVSNGNTITISGSGFGATQPNIVIFDDFELGTNGGTLSDKVVNAQIGTWMEKIYYNTPYFPVYSNSYKNSGNLSMKSDWNIGAEGASIRYVVPTVSGYPNRWFISFWQYLPTDKNVPGATGPYGANWKFWWLMENQNVYTMDYVGATGSANLGNLYPVCHLNGTSDRACLGYSNVPFAKGRWARFDVNIVGSTSSSGSVQGWFMDSAQARYSLGLATGKTLNSGATGWNYIRFPGFGRYDTNSATYMDDIYIATGNGAQARVEIGNNSTYSACTNLAISTPTSWSDSSIQATIRQGSFQGGSQAYLYIIDANGNVNAQGYPITIGGSSGTLSAPQKLCVISPQTGLCEQ